MIIAKKNDFNQTIDCIFRCALVGPKRFTIDSCFGKLKVSITRNIREYDNLYTPINIEGTKEEGFTILFGEVDDDPDHMYLNAVRSVFRCFFFDIFHKQDVQNIYDFNKYIDIIAGKYTGFPALKHADFIGDVIERYKDLLIENGVYAYKTLHQRAIQNEEYLWGNSKLFWKME
jgi:hypothetical protein